MEKLEGASTVLTMGILSIVLTVVCCGPFGVIFSIIGLVQAKKAQRTYDENPEIYSNYDSVKTGKILSYIGMGLAVIMLIFWILYFGIIFAAISSGDFDFSNID